MIPGNSFTTTPIVGDFISPNNDVYSPLTHVVRGGTALNSATAGRDVKNWLVYYESGTIFVKPVNSSVIAFSLVVPGVLTLDLAFDAAMTVVLCWTTASGASLYYFDTLTLSYIQRDFSNVSSCRVCADLTASYYSAGSDVIFAYTKNKSVFYRQQRDRYDVERLVGVNSTNTYRITKLGISTKHRLQFKLTDISQLTIAIKGSSNETLETTPIVYKATSDITSDITNQIHAKINVYSGSHLVFTSPEVDGPIIT